MIRVFASLSAFVALVLTPVVACDDKCNIYVGPHSSTFGEPSCQPQCPESFQQGGECGWQDQQCIFSTGKCRPIEPKRTICTCAAKPVGLRWDCQIKQCSCLCPCGVSIIQSCDSVDCAEPEDECPAKAKESCDYHCANPDGGPRPDGSQPDAPSADAGTDAPAPDTATADTVTPAPDQATPPVDTTVDVAPPVDSTVDAPPAVDLAPPVDLSSPGDLAQG